MAWGLRLKLSGYLGLAAKKLRAPWSAWGLRLKLSGYLGLAAKKLRAPWSASERRTLLASVRAPR